MPIARNHKTDGQRDILCLENDNGEDKIRIDHTGKIHLDPNVPIEVQADLFWNAVISYIPSEEQDAIDTKSLLIRSYNILKHLVKVKDNIPTDEKEFVENTLRDLNDYFGDKNDF
jgi:hypothetical protein